MVKCFVGSNGKHKKIIISMNNNIIQIPSNFTLVLFFGPPKSDSMNKTNIHKRVSGPAKIIHKSLDHYSLPPNDGSSPPNDKICDPSLRRLR